MKKMNLFFALMVGALIGFTSCSKDDDLSPEELEAKQTKELLEKISANFDDITSQKWALKEFQPSASMVAASQTQDGADALTTITNATHAKNFNLVLSFLTEGAVIKPAIDVNLTDEEIDVKLKAYQDEVYPEFADWGFILGKESTLATFRRVIAAPLAADDLKIDDITSDETGLCIFSIAMSDFSGLAYDDLVLARKKLIAGNNDNIYMNEDGTLTVETTSVKYGVSKLILEQVK